MQMPITSPVCCGVFTTTPEASQRADVKVLLLSAYAAQSHVYWRRGLQQMFPQWDWTCLELPPRYFSWRVRGNPTPSPPPLSRLGVPAAVHKNTTAREAREDPGKVHCPVIYFLRG